MSKREGIPLVASSNGGPRDNPKEDFRALYWTTLSGRKIGEIFGKVIGEIPPIDQFWFDKLNKVDPFEPEKQGRDNYQFVVYPSYIERSVNKEAPLDIDEEGNLVEVDPNTIVEKELAIPFSLKNLRVLCKYPLKGKEHLPVFDVNSLSEAFDKNTSFPKEVEVYFMRRLILGKSRNLPFYCQEWLLEERDERFKVTPLRIRSLANSISILESGTCPDTRGYGGDLWTYVRTPDTITIMDKVYQLRIGGFAPRGGLCVTNTTFDHSFFGVVPGGPAEVPRTLGLEHLRIDEGH